MLPIPERMLSRRNAQLYQRLLALQSDLHEKRSTIRMEKGMIDDAKARAAEANRSLILLRKQQSDMMSSSERDRERVTQVTVEVERLSKNLASLNGKIVDVTKQTNSVSLTVDDARAKLRAVEEEGQRLEEVVAEWVRENRETEKAEETAQIVMGRISTAIKQRLEKCNAISATCRALQSDYEEEKDASLQLKQQIAAMQEQTQVGGVDVENLKARIAELSNVCESLDEAIAIKAQIINTVAGQAEQLRRSRDEQRQRAEKEEQSVHVMERLDAESKAKKDQFAMRVREHEDKCRRIDDDAKTVERTVDATVLQKIKLENQLQHQKEELVALNERAAELERLRQSVAQSEKNVSGQLDNVKKADASASALETMSAIRLNQADHRFERSRQHLRDTVNKNQAAAIETGQLNEMVARCQKRLHVSVVEERAQQDAAQLDEKITQMQEECDKAAARLAYARGQAVDDPEMMQRRALMKERIASLESEEEYVAKEHAERDRAVRAVSRRLSAETTAGNFLQSDVEKAACENSVLEKENAAFYREISELVQVRQGKAATVESLWARINVMEQRVAATSSSTTEAAEVRIQMEREAAQRLAQIEAEKATLQHLINSQENDRHRAAMRLREMQDQIEILTARYNGVVHLLQVKVGAPDEQVTDALSAEEMRAKMVMQRAEKREELQSRGDALDQQICAMEREVLMLERALAHARQHVMDFAPLEAPPELDQAWQVVLRVEQERRSNEQAHEFEEKIAQIEQKMQESEFRAQTEYQKYAAIAEALDAAREEHAVLAKELRTLQKSRHLTTVEHNRARVVSRKLAVTKASSVPANAKVQPQQSVVPRMPRAAALHQALTASNAKKY